MGWRAASGLMGVSEGSWCPRLRAAAGSLVQECRPRKRPRRAGVCVCAPAGRGSEVGQDPGQAGPRQTKRQRPDKSHHRMKTEQISRANPAGRPPQKDQPPSPRQQRLNQVKTRSQVGFGASPPSLYRRTLLEFSAVNSDAALRLTEPPAAPSQLTSQHDNWQHN